MFDPSKMNPQMIAEVSELMRTLTPEQISKMQILMHNTMAGFNSASEMAAFEQSLPLNFREKMARLTYLANGIEVPPQSPTQSPSTNSAPIADPTNENEARLIILRSVASGMMSPEEALKVLFT